MIDGGSGANLLLGEAGTTRCAATAGATSFGGGNGNDRLMGGGVQGRQAARTS